MLTRECRPQTFEDMAGQDLNIKILKHIIDNPKTAPKSIIMQGFWGCGKCVMGSTRVATDSGYLPIGSLVSEPAEGFSEYKIKVYTRYGFKETSDFYYEKNCKVFLLETEEGFKINGTAKHRVLACLNGKIELTPIGSLGLGDTIVYPMEPIGGDWAEDISLAVYLADRFVAGDYSEDFVEEIFKLGIKSRVEFVNKVFSLSGTYGRDGSWVIGLHSPSEIDYFSELLHSLGYYFRVCGDSVEIIFNRKDYSPFYFCRIVSKEWTVSDVYDLTVPDVHEFYAQGTFNHNTTSARIFAKAINCTSKGKKPCGKCPNCLESLETSPFYTEYDSAIVGSVDKIRELRDTFFYTVGNSYKTIVFDEVHLSSKACQSALLKVLEDSPENIFYVLCTTDIEKVLPTIRSRSIELVFRGVSESDIVENLRSILAKRGQVADESILRIIARKSKGHMRDAHMLLDQYLLIGEGDFKQIVKSCIDLFYDYFEGVAKKNKDKVFSSIKEILKFPLAEISADYQEAVSQLTQVMVTNQGDPRLLNIVNLMGSNILKFIKLSISDWVIDSFKSDMTLQTALLCIYQMISPETKASTTNPNRGLGRRG